MNRHSGIQRCPRPVKGDTGHRAEQIAICLVLALEPGAPTTNLKRDTVDEPQTG